MATLPMTSDEVVERYYLEVRAKLLEIAASLDRIDRAAERTGFAKDQRVAKLFEALEILAAWKPRPKGGPGGRAERLQLLFSRPYDPNWLDNLLS